VNTARVQRALAEGMVLALISRLARLSIRREKAARNGHNLDPIAARAVIWRKREQILGRQTPALRQRTLNACGRAW
jgi:hypothetical protein